MVELIAWKRFSSVTEKYKYRSLSFTVNYVDEMIVKNSVTLEITHNRVMKNFVCLTDPSVRTVPLATSNPNSFSAFICPIIYNKKKTYHMSVDLGWVKTTGSLNGQVLLFDVCT